MLRYFQGEGLVRLARGSVELTGRERLRELAAELPVPCRVIAADVSDEQECRLLYEAVQSEELEVVINNAVWPVRRVCHRRSG